MRPVADRRSLGQQAHDRAGEHRLARARLADDAERLAPLERERHAVDRAHEAAVGLEVRLDVVDLEQRTVERRGGEALDAACAGVATSQHAPATSKRARTTSPR